MNIFRLCGDLSHLFAVVILLLKIWKTRSCAGISGKSQILFALVYITRYVDLFFTYVSLYNSLMKIFFIASSLAVVYLIYVKFKETLGRCRSRKEKPAETEVFAVGEWMEEFAKSEDEATYDFNHDTFRIEFLLLPCAILTFLITHDYSPVELLWTFSIYLESVAILPQLFMVSKTGEAETITSHYLFALGSYRAFYILNWIYRYFYENFFDSIAVVAGIVQTVLYADFFYLYITKVLKGKEFKLPA